MSIPALTFGAWSSPYKTVPPPAAWTQKKGPREGPCEGWQLLKGQAAIPGMKIPASGHANGSGFHNRMVDIGYTKFQVNGISKATLISICEKGPLDANNAHVPWNVGDAITYWAVDGPPKESYVQYGHAQMYIGSLTGKGNWTTDNKYNYDGSSMVYRRIASQTWNCVIFRAPRA